MKVANVMSAAMVVSLSIAGAILGANFTRIILVAMVLFVISTLVMPS